MNQGQRELLELAAHAMQQTGDRNFANYDVVEHAVCLELGCCCGAITSYWNPLVDKADAFDLMVKLPIGFINDETFVNVFRCGHSEPFVDLCEYFSEHPSKEAAFCMALTRAAAAIGKQMKGNGE